MLDTINPCQADNLLIRKEFKNNTTIEIDNELLRKYFRENLLRLLGKKSSSINNYLQNNFSKPTKISKNKGSSNDDIETCDSKSQDSIKNQNRMETENIYNLQDNDLKINCNQMIGTKNGTIFESSGKREPPDIGSQNNSFLGMKFNDASKYQLWKNHVINSKVQIESSNQNYSENNTFYVKKDATNFENIEKSNISLNLVSTVANKRILKNVSNFYILVEKQLSPEKRIEFNRLAKLMCDWLELNEEKFWGMISESISQVLLFLISSQIGISKKDFIQKLRPDVKSKRNLPKIENIKKLNCYPHMKKGFKQILEKEKS